MLELHVNLSGRAEVVTFSDDPDDVIVTGYGVNNGSNVTIKS